MVEPMVTKRIEVHPQDNGTYLFRLESLEG